MVIILLLLLSCSSPEEQTSHIIFHQPPAKDEYIDYDAIQRGDIYTIDIIDSDKTINLTMDEIRKCERILHPE